MAKNLGEELARKMKSDMSESLKKVFHKRRKEDSVVTHITVGNVLEDKEVFPTSKHIDIEDRDGKAALQAGSDAFYSQLKAAQEAYISQTNTSEPDISNMNMDDEKESISKDIDVDGISLGCISHSEENGRRLSKFVKELTKKPRVIYYQNGECQRTLM